MLSILRKQAPCKGAFLGCSRFFEVSNGEYFNAAIAYATIFYGNHRGILSIACMMLLYFLPAPLFATESNTLATENEIKSVYIFNFIRFTEWPGDSQNQPLQETTLSILGNVSLLKILKKQPFRQAAYGVRLKVHGCASLLCAKESQALFIDKTESKYLRKALVLLKNKPVLTISDISGFADVGGMVELKRQKGNVSFRINLKAIHQAGLYMSAQLLQLAEIVGNEP